MLANGEQGGTGRPTTSDLRFSALERRIDEFDSRIDKRLEGIESKIDKWFDDQSEFKARFERELAQGKADRERHSGTLYGKNGDAGLVGSVEKLAGLVNRMMWLGGILGALGLAVVAPLVVSLIGFVAWIFWLIVTNKIVVP